MQGIPLIDIGRRGGGGDNRQIAEAIREACETVGFFCLRGHGVGDALIARMRDLVRRCFALPEAEKRALAVAPGHYRGYIPLAAFSANAGSARPDLYEGFKLHTERPERDGVTIVPKNLWPARPAGFRAAILDYWAALDGLSDRLLRLFALALGLPEERLFDAFAWPMTNMTLLHYPPKPADEAGFGIHPHKDSDAFTILHPDPVGGLDVRPLGGDWTVVAAPADALVVNIGNMLELWSGGRFVSTPHRVVNRTGAERFSFPYFAVPNEAVSIEPLVTPRPGFDGPPLAVGSFMSELYRTNWLDQAPADDRLDVDTLDA